VREKRERKIKKTRKKKIGGEGGLKPTLLVGRNIKMQAPSNNTSSNISSNLHSLRR
jgi:hypothetical protein